MKVVDLHPEELLDRETRGELTALDRERLDAHLARCATCRFERDLRADFAAELDESDANDGLPSQRVTPLLALFEPIGAKQDHAPAALDAPEVPGDTLDTGPVRRGRGQRKNLRVLLLVAAALFVGSIATAGIGARVWDRLLGSGVDVTVTPPERPASPPATAVAASASAAATEHVFLEHDEASAPVEAELASAPVRSPASLAPPLAAAPVESAASLFESASAARRRGDYAEALVLHRRLQAQYASSREAHASQATVGRLLLDRGDAAGALASFDAYQKLGPGAFDEPVMVGRATALEREGRTADAREAWRALVVAFPDTPWRSHAESRLATSTP